MEVSVKSECLLVLLVSLELSLLLRRTLSLFLLFPLAFVFASLVAHLCFSMIKKDRFAQVRRVTASTPGRLADVLCLSKPSELAVPVSPL